MVTLMYEQFDSHMFIVKGARELRWKLTVSIVLYL